MPSATLVPPGPGPDTRPAACQRWRLRRGSVLGLERGPARCLGLRLHPERDAELLCRGRRARSSDPSRLSPGFQLALRSATYRARWDAGAGIGRRGQPRPVRHASGSRRRPCVPSLRPTTLLIPPPTWSPSRHSAPHRWGADPALAAQVEETLSTLTLKRQRFLRSYFQSGNAAQAVREAGYRVKDARSAADVGHEILASPTVQHAFQALREARGLSAEKLDQIHAAHLARHSSPDGGDRDRSLRALAWRTSTSSRGLPPARSPPSTSSSTR
jgi:hypothetical protein